ncbi:YbaY family lipoprotein [Luteimonas aquatica]|uniref:YbaY family lipoprotein n=1 Tax=Luteimonas aquatica TaxID=450364 RepID=UPI001F5758C1|nr:YbaY family lipoprotein [Luteimonas aquatica]
MRPILILALPLACMLAACQSPAGGAMNNEPNSSTAASEGAAAPPAAGAVIRGKATYLQRIKIAPGAYLTVQLIDGRLMDTPKAVLAQTTVKDVAGPPYAFELPYDPAKLRADGGMYGLHAALYGADGSLLFVTDTRVPYSPGHDDVGEFVMTMVGGAAAPAQRTPGGKTGPVWDDARRRGIAFRAVGNEPGWWVEVSDADPPVLRAELDYGERKLEVPRAMGISSTFGFGGKAADGTDVLLRIYREPCEDDMSGEAFDARAELTVGGKQYRGCGSWLDE